MRFPGQRYDAASGLNYNYFRDYEAATGRYVESDPIGLGGSTYGYVGGAPLVDLDFYGLYQVTSADYYCMRNPGACAGGTVPRPIPRPAPPPVGPRLTPVTPPSARPTPVVPLGAGGRTEPCDTCTSLYPQYDLCSWVRGNYPYPSAKYALLDFPSGSVARPPTPSEKGKCEMRGSHRTVVLNGGYVGSIFSCKCCVDTAGGPAISEVWGNNRDR